MDLDIFMHFQYAEHLAQSADLVILEIQRKVAPYPGVGTLDLYRSW